MRHDLVYALRSLQKHAGFTILAVLTLALGIGANAAIFSVVNGVLLKPLPFPDADRLVRVFTSTADDARNAHSAGDFRDLRAEQQSLEAIAGYRSLLFSTAADRGETIQLTGAYVTSEFFEVIGVRAALGRAFSRATDPPSGERKVVLSDSAWRRLFGSGSDVAGASVRVDGEPYTVVGVMPPLLAWPLGADIWVLSQKDVPPSPVAIAGAAVDREVRYFDAIARIRREVTPEQAQQDLTRVAGVVQQRNLPTAERRDIGIVGLREEIVGDVEPVLLVLQAAVGMVLLIACANVSGLLIARAAARRRELAVRAALGASSSRLIRQLLVESLLLSAVGGLAGLLLGAWLVSLLTGLLPRTVPRIDTIGLDRVVAVVTFAAALITGLLFGIMPALQASRADAQAALKDAGSRAGTASRKPARSILVVAEIALTLVLLSGAGLLVHSLVKLQRVEPGLSADQVTVTGLLLPQWRYQTSAAQLEVFRRLLESLGRSGEVQAVGIGFPGPLRGDNASGAFTVEGYGGAASASRPHANLSTVSGGFFKAMGIPLVAGRTFTARDGADAPRVAIVSASLARKYWPGQDPLGRRLRFDDDNAAWTTVVGIVGDVRQLGLHQDPPPILYMPYEQFALPFTSIAVRSAAPTSAVVSLVRSSLVAIDPSLTAGPTRPLQDLLDASLAQPRFRTTLLAAFALVALVLAAVGIYGVISASVSQRTREIGIRIALGARPRQVLAQVMREGLRLTIVGVGIGLIGGLLAARLIAAFLFGVDVADPLTFAAVAAILIGVALTATYIPSRRALRVDPLTALRTD